MIIVNSDTVKADDNPNVAMRTLFKEEVIKGAAARFGKVTVPSKARIPLNGTGVHEQDEYSYVVKGSLVTGIGDQEYRLTAGDAALIPAGEAHWSYNDGQEECEIIWTLVPRC